MTLHFDTIGKFSAYADTRATIRTALRDDFALEGDTLEKRSAVAAVIMAWESCKSYVTKEADIKAEAKLLGVTRPIAHTDRTAMKAAFEKTHYRLEEHLEPSEAYLSAKVEEVEGSEITASPLSDVTSRKTSRDSGIQTTVDQNGHVRVVKSKVKGQLPQNTEELRLVRKEAVKTSVRENRPLAEVLPEKSRDSEIREQHFISPIALQSVINEGRGNRLRWQQEAPTQQRWQPYQPWSRNTEKGDKGYKGKHINMKGSRLRPAASDVAALAKEGWWGRWTLGRFDFVTPLQHVLEGKV
ncbi:glyQS [Symbiodinium microadriaticum]|nr:glyQS [Symbiodinium microadriaticum]